MHASFRIKRRKKEATTLIESQEIFAIADPLDGVK